MGNLLSYEEIALTDKAYNLKLEDYMFDFRKLNEFVMSHTYSKNCLDTELAKAIYDSTSKQVVIYENEELNIPKDGPTTNIIMSKKRSFEAARSYIGKKIAVLNFANNHNVGGAPFSAGAQEESLCRISTLYNCLLYEYRSFYAHHKELYKEHKINHWGNSDLIYTPDVVVYKSDESAPKMLEKKDWYKVDVITSAAPKLPYDIGYIEPMDWGAAGLPRLRRVFEIAKKNNVEVLILGAWGCGAFHNPPEAVALTFKLLLEQYHFETVEFAIYSNEKNNRNYDVFHEIIMNSEKGE